MIMLETLKLKFLLLLLLFFFLIFDHWFRRGYRPWQWGFLF